MKRLLEKWLIPAVVATGLLLPGAYPPMAEDMREDRMVVEEQKAALLKAVEAEKAAAEAAAEESRKRILADRGTLVAAVAEQKARLARLEEEHGRLEIQLADTIKTEKELNAALARADDMVGELTGVIRISARDLNALMAQSLQTAFAPEQIQRLEAIADQSSFPGMADIQKLVDLYFTEINRSGEVRIEEGPFIRPTGETARGKILVLGNFTAAYQKDGAVGFLNYTPENMRLQALAKPPKRSIRHQLADYMDGRTPDVPIDISRGAALRQMAHGTGLLDKIPQGGPIVWPILGILAAAALITLERGVHLARKALNAGRFMTAVFELAVRKDWPACEALCRKHSKKPLARVILSGIGFVDQKREDMENAVQEAILREIPPLEKYLSTLGMLAAIAPLLGLLGTVTGMINTFHMITFYGTGDARMMSGGISEALVTTMLGLMVAIPIMFVHTLLSRKVETLIGEMEEKAVSFINMVFKTRQQI